MAAAQGLDVDQIDVKTAFLNGDLSEEVYIRLPKELGGQVWKLEKALYGLKQAARAWHEKLREEMTGKGFSPSAHDPCLFYKGEGEERVYVLFHVDDGAVVGKTHAVAAAKKAIGACFDIKDMGPVSYFLGLEILRNKDGSITVSQEKYAHEVLARFNMTDCKTKTTPMEVGQALSRDEGELFEDGTLYRELVGSLMYLACNTRPDLAHSMSVLSRFMSAPCTKHWGAAKRVLCYLKGTTALGLTYPSAPIQGVLDLVAYGDSDYAADIDKRRSTTGMVLTIHGRAVVWLSQLQSVVATSTTEAEFIAAATTVKEGLWLRKLLSEIRGFVTPVRLMCDNQSSVKLIKQPTAGQRGRSKHIDVQHHFIRDRYQRGDISVSYVESSKQLADIFTKQLPGPDLMAAVKQITGHV